MQDEHKPKEQLIIELHELRERVAELEKGKAEPKRAKEALPESGERYRDLLEHSRTLMCTHDLEGRVLSVSAWVTELLGYPQEVILQMNIRDILAPEVRHMFTLYLEELQRHGAAQGLMSVQTSTGARRVWEYRNTLRREGLAAPIVLGLAHDITDLRKAEQALLESEERFRLFMDNSPTIAWMKDEQGRYVYFNKTYENRFGVRLADWLGKTDLEVWPEETADEFMKNDQAVLAAGHAIEVTEETVNPDSSLCYWLNSKFPLRDLSGKQYVAGIGLDITGLKQTEEALRTSEIKYRIVADNTYDWEYWVSPEGRFLYTSPSCQRITGYAANEFQADPKLLFRIIHPDDLAHFEAHLEPDQIRSEPHRLEFRIFHRDGTMGWIGHVCQPVFDAQGRFLGRRGSNRDITDRKQAEEALQDSAQKLKLFAYSVAHDLKSPAIGVYALSKRLSKYAKDVLDEKGRNYCDQILKVSEHIAALVDKVNVYIATKEARLSIEIIDIGEILQMLKDEFSAQLSIRQIDWRTLETAVKINADRLSILRVFRNLVDNSLKYGGEGMSTIWTVYEDSEDFHIFSFSDNGRGLKEEDSEKIFRAFQRNETSRGVEGAGLGLTIIKEIAEQHGGKVWVEPRGKKGITFCISISKSL